MVSDGLSVLDALQESATAKRIALIDRNTPLSYRDFGIRIENKAAELEAQGVRAGSRVAMRATCDANTVVTFFALLELGAAFVALHPRLTDQEVADITEDARPDLVIEPLTLSSNSSNKKIISRATADSNAPLAVLYTSGTAGRPKGAVLTRGAFAASAQASAANVPWRDDNRWLVCMPLAHVGGLSILTRCVAARKPIVLESRFDPEAVLRTIELDHVSQISAVPTMLRALFDVDKKKVLSKLRFVLLGGAAAPPALLEEAAKKKVVVLTTYGLTEGCSQVTCQRLRAAGTTEAGSGHVLPGLGLRIWREDGKPAAADEVGRIQIQGPNLMRGYLAAPGEPLVLPLTVDGWFDTGDLGALDNTGRLFVHARRTDLVITGGENVYPAEVELCLEAMKGIRGAVVVGVPDERWGQIVAAGVVLAGDKPEHHTRAASLVSTATARLAPHKRPRLAAALPSLPQTAAGKLDRAAALAALTGLLVPVPRAT